MAKKFSKHMDSGDKEWKRNNSDKREITVTLAESMNGKILTMQFIYKGKTNRSLTAFKFPAGLF